MHVMIGTAVVAGFIAFVFGEHMARIFIGTLLALAALFILGIIGLTMLDMSRQDRRPQTVHMGPAQ
jgi:hypothetical protein